MLLARLLSGFQSLPSNPQANWTLLVLIPGWVVWCTFQDPMGLSSKLSCKAESFSQPPQVFSVRCFETYFPTLEPCVMQSVSLPSCSSWFIFMQMYDLPLHQLPCCTSSPSQLPLSAPSTSLDECFFFKSLVVRLSYSSIFWQFWLFFVFKFVVVLLLVV